MYNKNLLLSTKSKLRQNKEPKKKGLRYKILNFYR